MRGSRRLPRAPARMLARRRGNACATDERRDVAIDRGRRGGFGGISLGGIIVIVGILVALFWSLLLGIIIILIGLIAFGGFVRGRWY
jgi:hypothetical protein